MASARSPIVIDDADDNGRDVGNLAAFYRSRSLSAVSVASSHTMRAESSELEAIPAIERLSVQPTDTCPSDPCRPSPNGSSKINHPLQATLLNFSHKSIANSRRRRLSSDLVDEGGPARQRPRLSPNDQAARPYIDLEENEDFRARPYDEKNDQIIDLDAMELKLEEEIFQERQSHRGKKSASLAPSPRNVPVVLPFVELDLYQWNNSSLKAGKTVELTAGTFLKIKTIVQNLETDAITLRGWQLKRAKSLGGMVPLKINELTFIFEVDLNDPRDHLEQSVVEVALEDVVRIRKLICTNHPFPKFRFDMEHVQGDSREARLNYVQDHEVLVARWKLTTKFENGRDRIQNPKKPNNCVRRQLEALIEAECTTGCAMTAHLLRFAWRGETILGGSGTKSEIKHGRRAGQPKQSEREKVFISLLDDQNVYDSNKENANACQHRHLTWSYTFGDTFSGAGGSFRGALRGGFELKFATDCNPICCATLRANFQDIKVYEKWAHEFAVLRGELYVDVLHLSPPCQVFSPAHTRPGADDEMNFASLFAVLELIKKTKPRIVTLEQTFGILREKYRGAFNSLIRMFIDAGYSPSWQVVQFANFGLAQKRRRLIIVAAGPGETLPEFPSYTHSAHGVNGLKPWTSVREVLSKIPNNAVQHDKRAAAAGPPHANWHKWDDSSVVPCITTNGGDDNCHPSGTRSLTYRELAALQSFPHEHFFVGNSGGVIKRQIGNAVPPMIAKIIFESIRKHLEIADAAETRRGRDLCENCCKAGI